ncbi:Scr1 family TA system antitoxin-like transcriptional regulator [Kitasatospora sp. NBC_00240]|uniref:helix-turn-helix domain-containing protein n=1 Tax=Kitasatospora sp. NBC_00240 TaxID=2903567 RepID=UPI00225337EA|nr:Scr1 family TA system antitoxin-like transcriptional regulator [Kitasatospora sp. NBC_00240]MCX5213725.1 Scr1 family TA system antitoxin-like transcriptional regulator [Kitasatospora sp. NBC_00240]
MTRVPRSGPHLRSSAAALFGTLLRRTREARGMSQGELARQIPCSRPHLTRIENGSRVPQHDLVTVCDRILETGGELLEIWEEVDWYAQVDHPNWFQRFVLIEAKAASIQEYQTPWISGLLQTEAYARALISTGNAAGDHRLIDERVAARLARQHRLSGPDALQLTVILSEVTLRQNVGGAQVMHDQLRHLLRAGRQPNVTIQVAPFTLGERVQFGTSLILLTSPDGKTRAYSESLAHGRFVEDPQEVQRWQQRYDLLRAEALSAQDSARLIRSVMEGLLNMDSTIPDLSKASWRKASYSDSESGQCVEVADNIPGVVPVRDSKDPQGPALLFRTDAWQSFVTGVRNGEFPAVDR